MAIRHPSFLLNTINKRNYGFTSAATGLWYNEEFPYQGNAKGRIAPWPTTIFVTIAALF